MNFTNKNIIIWAVVILLLVGAAFAYLTQSNSSSSDTLVVSQANNDNVIGSKILTAIAQVDKLRLDDSIFNRIKVLGLRDYSKELPDPASVPLSRPNPFEPLVFSRQAGPQNIPGGTQTFNVSTSTATSTKPSPTTKK